VQGSHITKYVCTGHCGSKIAVVNLTAVVKLKAVTLTEQRHRCLLIIISLPRCVRLTECCLIGVLLLSVLIGYFNTLIFHMVLCVHFMVECGRVQGGI